MKGSVLVAGLALAAGAIGGGNADAQTLPPEQQRLKQLLEQKYSGSRSSGGAPASSRGPTTRSLGAPPPVKSAPAEKRLDPKDFYVVDPDGKVREKRSETIGLAEPMRGAAEGDSGGVLAWLKSWFGGASKPHSSQATADVAGAAATGTRTRSLTPTDASAQNAPPVVKAQVAVEKDSYVIRLKPDVTGDQIDALLEKYNLEVTKAVPVLGVLHVTPKAAPPAAATRGMTRSLAPEAKPDTLSEALAPRIIQELRNEPAVGSAFVNSTVAPKTLPPRSETKTQSGDVVYGWNWQTGVTDDGNWGHKMMRLPPVWTILNASRIDHPERARTPKVFLDTGFGLHGQLTYHNVQGGLTANPESAECGFSHGTHVAGIAGAIHGSGRGIDGIVPDAVVDAVPISAELWVEGISAGVKDKGQSITTLYAQAITDLAEYLLSASPLPAGKRRVVNVSLAYNWVDAGARIEDGSIADESLKAHVLNQADLLRFVATMTINQVLFVAAAGNDSEGLATPVQAKWFTPFAFAGTHSSDVFQPLPNILVVEAIDRAGMRAPFSNAGGHVSAPGVDVMSTLAGPSDTYGVCSGTSQAAPHVAALAAILFELDPARTPAEIGRIIRESAVVDEKSDAAPRIDAFEAVLRLKPDLLKSIVDLNGDENVDALDLAIFRQHLVAIMEEDAGGASIALDLNGDGNINGDERCWPLIDFNASGKVSFDLADARPVGGQMLGDLDVVKRVWTDTAKPFEAAVAELGIDKLAERWKATSQAGQKQLVATDGPSRGGMSVSCR